MRSSSGYCMLVASALLWCQCSYVICHPVDQLSVKFLEDTTRHRDSDLVKQSEKTLKFDWERDEPVKDIARKHHLPTHRTVLRNVTALLKTENNKFIVASKNITKLDRGLRSDVKSILWFDGYDITTKRNHRKVVEPLRGGVVKFNNGTGVIEMRNSTGPTVQKGPSNIHSAAEGVQSNIFYNAKLSVSEDKLRYYNLSSGERYGFGRAKPKLITAQLSKADVIEYNGENNEFSDYI